MSLHFLRPYWFLAIIPALFLCWRLSKVSVVDNWRKVCDEHLISSLLIAPKYTRNFPIMILALANLIAIIALAGPSWAQQASPIYRATLGSVILLDLSPSMTDQIGTTKKIDRARYKIIDYLKQQHEGYTGLAVYTDEVHVISPLTDDNNTIANFIPVLDPNIMPTFEDNTDVALKEAGKLLKQGGLNHGNVILITDKITNLAAAKQTAKKLYEEGYRLYILNLSQQDSRDEMNALANVGGGKAISLSSNNTDIETLVLETKMSAFAPGIKKTAQKGVFWQDNGRILVFLLLPLALIAFRRGYL